MLATVLLATLLSASSTVTTTEAMQSQTLVTYDEFMQSSSRSGSELSTQSVPRTERRLFVSK